MARVLPSTAWVRSKPGKAMGPMNPWAPLRKGARMGRASETLWDRPLPAGLWSAPPSGAAGLRVQAVGTAAHPVWGASVL